MRDHARARATLREHARPCAAMRYLVRDLARHCAGMRGHARPCTTINEPPVTSYNKTDRPPVRGGV